jgi:hypothetical protein
VLSRKAKRPFLIVVPARNALHVDLVEIVLTGFLEQESGLESMGSLDLRDVVGNVVDRAGRVGRIWQAAQLVERPAERNRRYFIVDVLTAREQVRVVDAIPGAVEQAIGGVDSYVDPVYASGGKDSFTNVGVMFQM